MSNMICLVCIEPEIWLLAPLNITSMFAAACQPETRTGQGAIVDLVNHTGMCLKLQRMSAYRNSKYLSS